MMKRSLFSEREMGCNVRYREILEGGPSSNEDGKEEKREIEKGIGED